MKTIHRLGKYLESKRIKPVDFEKTCDISNGYFARQLKAGGSVGSDILEKIAEAYPDLNLVWLITGKGAMITKPPKTTKEDEEANMIVEEEQALYKKKNELIDNVKEMMDNVKERIAELQAIDGLKKKGGRRKKN